MTSTNNHAKLTLGLLLVGASALPASGILGSLLGAAGGVGGNWLAESLGSVFQAGPPPDEALRNAFVNAVREAAMTLRKDYGTQRVANDPSDAFNLLRDTARSVTTLELPPEVHDLAVVQRNLAIALDQLLYGHPDAQVKLIKQHLLPTTARAFQAELARNDHAWRLYHSWLLERMLTQNLAVQTALAAQPTARAELLDVVKLEAHFDLFGEQLEVILQALRDLLEQAAQTPAHPDQATLTLLQEMEAKAITRASQQATDITGRLHQRMQATETISDSTQIATGVRYTHPPAPLPAPAPSPAAPSVISLDLRMQPMTTGATITWEGDAIGSHHSTFVSPYQGSDLDLVLRALDYRQYPGRALSATDLVQLDNLGLPVVNGMIADGLERMVGQQLYAALTKDPNAARALTSARDAATRATLPLRLSLHLDQGAVDLAALPWELLWANDEPTPILLSRSAAGQLIRHLGLSQAVPAPRPGGRPLRVLAVTPHAGISAADRATERQQRESAWASLVANGAVTLLPDLSPATPEALAATLRAQAGQLDVLHLVAHGTYRNGEGSLVLDGPNDEWAPTPISQLAPAIGNAGARLVVLSACQSAAVGAEPIATGLLGGVAPALIAHGVPCVVAMQLTVRSHAAHSATRVIYEQLAAGHSIQAAVAAARLHLWSSEPERVSWFVPTLYVRAKQVDQKSGMLL